MPAMSRLESSFCASGPWAALARRSLVPWALGGAELEGSAIEVGAGGGAMAAQLLERFPALRLTATDLAPAMVARARQRLASFGARATVREADATALPFPDGAFDTALSFLMLHHVGRWERALEELVRVVVPGGELVVYDLLDAAVNRLAHGVTRSEVRLIRADELPVVMERLPLRGASLRRPGGQVFRMRARRAE